MSAAELPRSKWKRRTPIRKCSAISITQTLDTLTLLCHLRMDVEIERQIDCRMTKQFADRLAVAARLDTARSEGVTERMKPNMREIVPGKETVVELTIRADFRTLDISANEIALRIFLAKPFQYRQKNWRKRDFSRRGTAFGCGYDNLRLAHAI